MSEIKVKTIEPSTGTNLTLGASGDTVTSSADSIKVNTFKDAGGNTLWTSDGSGTLSSINAGFSVAGAKLILSQTASSSATIEFTSNIDSTYDIYMFVCTDINPATDGQNFQFQVNASGQTGFNEAMTTTFFKAKHRQDDTYYFNYTASADQANGTAYQNLTLATGSDADQSGAGILYLFNPSSTTYCTQFYATFPFIEADDSAEVDFIQGYIIPTAAITEISFKFSSGNINAGKITMYGIV